MAVFAVRVVPAAGLVKLIPALANGAMAAMAASGSIIRAIIVWIYEEQAIVAGVSWAQRSAAVCVLRQQ